MPCNAHHLRELVHAHEQYGEVRAKWLIRALARPARAFRVPLLVAQALPRPLICLTRKMSKHAPITATMK